MGTRDEELDERIELLLRDNIDFDEVDEDGEAICSEDDARYLIRQMQDFARALRNGDLLVEHIDAYVATCEELETFTFCPISAKGAAAARFLTTFLRKSKELLNKSQSFS